MRLGANAIKAVPTLVLEKNLKLGTAVIHAITLLYINRKRKP